jgi:hypothetical protein
MIGADLNRFGCVRSSIPTGPNLQQTFVSKSQQKMGITVHLALLVLVTIYSANGQSMGKPACPNIASGESCSAVNYGNFVDGNWTDNLDDLCNAMPYMGGCRQVCFEICDELKMIDKLVSSMLS